MITELMNSKLSKLLLNTLIVPWHSSICIRFKLGLLDYNEVKSFDFKGNGAEPSGLHC